MQTCGQGLIKLIADYGIDTVFGIPGVHTLELYRGLDGVNIRHVQPRHEQGAAFMADGYARVSGRPAACFLITGPGLTNALTGIGQAYSDSVPMLIISSVNDSPSLNKHWGRLHEIPHQRRVSEPLTAFSATVISATDMPDTVQKAFSAFTSARSRPVHIEIPTDVFVQEVDHDWHARPTPVMPRVDDRFVDQVATELEKANSPLIIAGGGCVLCAEQVMQLAERVSALVVTTIAGKGVMPPNHPLSLGSTLYLSQTRKKVRDADLVLALGTEFSETDTISARQLEFSGKLIRVDIDLRELADNHPADLTVHGDVNGFLPKLLQVATPAKPQNDFSAERYRKFLLSSCSNLQKKHLKVLDVLFDALDGSAVITADMTQIAYTGNTFYQAPRPRSWLFPAGFGTLGYALPAAIGAKLAAPGRDVLALVGDGGFMFTLSELVTAVELGLPLVIVLWNNNAYGQIRDDMQTAGIPLVGVLPKNPDFRQVVHGLGAEYVKPDSEAELSENIVQAFNRHGPTVIEINDDGFIANG